MKIQNAKQEIPKLLSCFSKTFSSPSFKIFSSFITGFIQLGKEPHTSSMVQSLTYSFLHRSLSSFTRFLGQNIWSLEEVTEIALEQFFHTLHLKAHSVLFLIIDDTIAQKSGQGLRLPLACKLYVLADSWYWAKALANVCRECGYHMISQLKSSSVLWMNGKKTKVTTFSTLRSAYRDVSPFLYGKSKTLKIARFVGTIQGLGKVAVVVVKEKRKKTSYLVSTNLHLSALDIIRYYAKRWKIEQMIKDLKQRLGFGDYQVRNLQAIQRHVALSLLSYTLLILLKILQWLRDQTV